jgi:uncharacterized phage-associated protein
MIEDKLTTEDINAWEHDPVTKLFMEYLDRLKNNYDDKVHTWLLNSSGHINAVSANGSLDAILEVIAGPERMKNDIREEENKQ